MTIMDKINSRARALVKNYNRRPIGIVVDYHTYRQITSDKSMRHEFIFDYEQFTRGKGETFMGLDVAITKKENTLILY